MKKKTCGFTLLLNLTPRNVLETTNYHQLTDSDMLSSQNKMKFFVLLCFQFLIVSIKNAFKEYHFYFFIGHFLKFYKLSGPLFFPIPKVAVFSYEGLKNLLLLKRATTLKWLRNIGLNLPLSFPSNCSNLRITLQQHVIQIIITNNYVSVDILYLRLFSIYSSMYVQYVYLFFYVFEKLSSKYQLGQRRKKSVNYTTDNDSYEYKIHFIFILAKIHTVTDAVRAVLVIIVVRVLTVHCLYLSPGPVHTFELR